MPEGLEAEICPSELKSNYSVCTSCQSSGGTEDGSSSGLFPPSGHPALSVSRSHGLSQSERLAAVWVLGPARKPVGLEGEKQGGRKGGQIQGQTVQGPGGLQKVTDLCSWGERETGEL